jgi:hypothetical protein
MTTGNIVALWWSFYLSRQNNRSAAASSLVLARKMY